MDPDRFSDSLTAAKPPDRLAGLLLALWHDGRGDWTLAHAITQAQQGVLAAAVHAYLHRKQGDLANADYWYGRAGRARGQGSLHDEWRALVRELLA